MSVPGADHLAVEGGLVTVELPATFLADDDTIVHIVGAATLGTMELLAIVLPGERITGATILVETVGTLAFVSDEDIVVAAGADEDAVVGPKHTTLLILTVCTEQDVLKVSVIVASGLEMANTFLQTSFNLTEVPWIAKDARQLTRLWMKLGVEDEITLVLTIDSILAIA